MDRRGVKLFSIIYGSGIIGAFVIVIGLFAGELWIIALGIALLFFSIVTSSIVG